MPNGSLSVMTVPEPAGLPGQWRLTFLLNPSERRALWENHCESACGPVRRRTFEEGPRDKVLIVTKSTMTKWWWPH